MTGFKKHILSETSFFCYLKFFQTKTVLTEKIHVQKNILSHVPKCFIYDSRIHSSGNRVCKMQEGCSQWVPKFLPVFKILSNVHIATDGEITIIMNLWWNHHFRWCLTQNFASPFMVCLRIFKAVDSSSISQIICLLCLYLN